MLFVRLLSHAFSCTGKGRGKKPFICSFPLGGVRKGWHLVTGAMPVNTIYDDDRQKRFVFSFFSKTDGYLQLHRKSLPRSQQKTATPGFYQYGLFRLRQSVWLFHKTNTFLLQRFSSCPKTAAASSNCSKPSWKSTNQEQSFFQITGIHEFSHFVNFSLVQINCFSDPDPYRSEMLNVLGCRLWFWSGDRM